MCADEADARHFLAESRERRTGHLKVGAVGPFHATEMLVAFHARYPEIEISVSIGNSNVVLRNLLEFESDVAVLAYVENDERLWFSQYSQDRSEEHTSELQSLMRISYAVFCLKNNSRQINDPYQL